MTSRAILVVDDDPVIRFCLERLLSSEGFRVTSVADADAALAQVDAAPPDVVVLDIVLDETDGYAFCRRLKDRPGVPELKVVMVSARARPDERERGHAAGADGYLAKPFGVAALKQTLEDVLLPARV